MGRSSLGVVPLVAAALATALVAGCGAADEPSGTTAAPAATAPDGGSEPGASAPDGAEPAPTAAALEDRSFAAVTFAGRRPVAGSNAGISFADGRIAVTTGCNTLSGTYAIAADGRLRAPDLVQTMMGCEPALTRQEDALRELLESGPRVALAGERLTLTGADGTALVLTERAEAPGPRPIAGTRWVLETIAGPGGADGSASSVPAGVEPPTLLIGEDGAVELFAGCNRGGGRATVRDDGFVVFGPIALTRMACDSAATAVEAAVTAILSGRVAAGFSEQKLVLAKRGRSLTFAPAG